MIADLSGLFDWIRKYMNNQITFMQFYYAYKEYRSIPNTGIIHVGINEYIKEFDVMVERARCEFTLSGNITQEELKRWIIERIYLIKNQFN